MRILVSRMRRSVSPALSGGNSLPHQLSVAGRGHTHGLTEQPRGMATAMPTDLAHRLLNRHVGLPQQAGKPLDADGDQVGHRGLAVGVDEHTTKLRGRQVHGARKRDECPPLGRIATQDFDSLASLSSQGRELTKARWTRMCCPTLGRRPTYRTRSDIWRDDIEQCEQQGLHPVEPIR